MCMCVVGEGWEVGIVGLRDSEVWVGVSGRMPSLSIGRGSAEGEAGSEERSMVISLAGD